MLAHVARATAGLSVYMYLTLSSHTGLVAIALGSTALGRGAHLTQDPSSDSKNG